MDFNRKIVLTADGSKTIYFEELNESYHSKHGAVQESLHVFIKNGLDLFTAKQEISIIEFGFGTGLNCLSTLFSSFNKNQTINYTGIEKYPILKNEFLELDYFNSVSSFFANLANFKEALKQDYLNIFEQEWNSGFNKINPTFYLSKLKEDFLTISFLEKEKFDLVFYDAFGPRVQPELWEKDLFTKIFNHLNPNGVLTTYCSKGIFQRTLKEIGFDVKKINGPIGKREMINAIKPI